MISEFAIDAGAVVSEQDPFASTVTNAQACEA